MGRNIRAGLLLGAAACLLAVMADWVVAELASQEPQAAIEPAQAAASPPEPSVAEGQAAAGQAQPGTLGSEPLR